MAVSFQALSDQIVNDRLCARRRDREVERASTWLVDEEGRSAPHITDEPAQRIARSDPTRLSP